MTTLSGLACLNYPNAIKPIVDNLPSFLRFKWEKEVVKYAEENNDLYPTFHQFSVMIHKQARLKNHPNMVASEHLNPNDPRPRDPKRERPKDNRVFKTRAEDINDDKEFGVDNKNERFCSFHERKGHELDKVEKQENEERNNDEERVNEDLQPRCTSVCQGRLGGLSCSKILLVDAYAEDRPENAHKVYAIMDDQSNASMISPELADLLDIDSPKQKYLLTTCSGAKETKYGRRVSGLFVKSMCGRIAKLPNLIECEHVPQDKT
ncbi:Hypothetical predicted protein [Paramuricea clavata]|uniref:Uncharacterized protein n=1 Tax=Paramuricea clavata TaxID=317549 RepID=A0A6S7GBB4_PARCT|nr:Hypothetical predicted protein [Paramuricea clavata]